MAAGVGTATPKGFGAGVEVSDDVALSSSGWRAGVFAGFGVSSSSRAGLVFPISLLLREDSFSWDFFFAVFGLGVGVWRRFDLCEAAPGSGVSRGVAFRDVASSSDFSGGFGLRARGESCASADLRSLPADSSVAIFALGIGVGAFFPLEKSLFRFLTLRSLISHVELRWALFLALQRLDVFSPIYPSMI